jgi:hypothetical protein
VYQQEGCVGRLSIERKGRGARRRTDKNQSRRAPFCALKK